MKHFSTKVARVMALAALLAGVGLTACERSELPVTADADRLEAPAPSASVQPADLPPHQQVARLIALALQDADVRNALDRALDKSPIDEEKLHLQTYLRGAGGQLVAEMARKGDVTKARIYELLRMLQSFEIYLPVDAHRAQWEGSSNIIVATVLDDDPGSAPPVGFELNGEKIILSAKGPPPAPTISVVPAESFDDQGNPLGRIMTRPNFSEELYEDSPPGDGTSGSSDTYTGVWITEIHTASDYEGSLKGDAEMVMFAENVDDDQRSTLVCAEEDETVEPYRFDFNGGDYYKDFLILMDSDIPDNTNIAIYLYEDDDERCVVHDDKDYVKLAGDAIANAYESYKAYQERDVGQAGMNILNAIIAVKEITETNDEFVGLLAPDHDIDETVRTFFGRDENLNKTIRLDVVWDTRDAE